jgi:Fe-S-cluster-containing dehydrogenase component
VQAGQAGATLNPAHEKYITAIASDLKQSRGSSIIIAGEYQPPAVHALAHAMNQALGNAGNTVLYTDPLEANPVNGLASIKELVNDMNSGAVDTLIIIGGNPVYDAPADLDFAGALRKVRLRAHLSLYRYETSELCQWHINQAHYLESWSDVRAFDGTASIIQPLIAPLYHGKTAHEVLAAFSDQPERSSYEIVRGYWARARATGGAASQGAASGFEQFWRKALHDGLIAGTALPQRTVAVSANFAAAGSTPPAPGSGYEIIFRPDPTVYDGRFANNGWLQELPKPLSKLTWDNAAYVSPATARKLGVGTEIGRKGGGVYADVVNLNYKGRSLEIAIWILPGHPDDCVTVTLGYGRTNAGRVGSNQGSNAYLIRTSDAPWFGSDLQITPTGKTYLLAATQLHHLIANEGEAEGVRDLVRSGTLEQYKEHPALEPEGHHERETVSLYPSYEYPGYAWGMTIDLNACIGCSACVVACQAENNIPVVGKDQVARSREMHWLRVDSYYKGGESNPETFFQPVPCMHCENAPCEVVCPVAATAHSAEGLNDMVYNRCVGTRYCSNNCPYKVRRFNFFLYQDWETPTLKFQRNPDVSVRSRGVMEKCTYCVQRIQEAKIEAEKEDRRVRDGEVITACAAACPAEAIVFGDINDPGARVTKLKSEHRNYGLLPDLNTRPRTTYLAAVRNPNPELKETEKA